MKQLNAQEVLSQLIDTLLWSLEDLTKIKNTPSQQFAYGEKTAYVECLEIVQLWEQAEQYGVDFNIEQKFPL